MRVLLLSPVLLDAPRGNAVTVARIARGLRDGGVKVHVRVPAEGGEGDLASEAKRVAPDVVHAFHARRTGPLGQTLAGACGAALVVTLTGTDVSDDLRSLEHGPLVREALGAARAVTVFHASVAAEVAAAVPEVLSRMAVVPQSVGFPPAPVGAPGPGVSGDPCVLFPAGIRAVKRPRLPLAPLDELARRRPAARLWYAGPVLEEDEHARLLAALDGRPWARYLGAAPHGAMPALLARADIVLNCSASEGGMANSVLEALALGRAVLASDIPGNRSVVEDGVTGMLFASEAELAERAERLAADPTLRRRLGEAGRRFVETRFTPAVERDGYLAVYARVLGRRSGS
jgi:hypothetical protein